MTHEPESPDPGADPQGRVRRPDDPSDAKPVPRADDQPVGRTDDQPQERGPTELSPEEEPTTTGTLFIMVLFLMALAGLWAIMYFTLLNR